MHYGVVPALIEAISKVESGGYSKAQNRNQDGSEDLGDVQINSRWLGVLAAYGTNQQNSVFQIFNLGSKMLHGVQQTGLTPVEA